MMHIALIVACFIGGYWLVSRFISASPRLEDAEPQRATMSNWYVILGVRENATYDEIKTAYRRAIAKVHPDRFANAPELTRARAEAKSKQINAAYELGSRLFQS